MTDSNNITTQPLHTALLGKRMLIGAGIGLVLILFFLIQSGGGNPAWGKFWMIRPLIVVPLAGATAGVFYHFMDHWRYKGGWKKVLANVVSVLVYVIGLWMGVVLGLVGTMWN